MDKKILRTLAVLTVGFGINALTTDIAAACPAAGSERATDSTKATAHVGRSADTGACVVCLCDSGCYCDGTCYAPEDGIGDAAIPNK